MNEEKSAEYWKARSDYWQDSSHFWQEKFDKAVGELMKRPNVCRKAGLDNGFRHELNSFDVCNHCGLDSAEV